MGAAEDCPWMESLRRPWTKGGGTTSAREGNPGLVIAAFDWMRRLVFLISLRVQVRDCLRPSLVTSVPIDFGPRQHLPCQWGGAVLTSTGLRRPVDTVRARVTSVRSSRKPCTSSNTRDSVSEQFPHDPRRELWWEMSSGGGAGGAGGRCSPG